MDPLSISAAVVALCGAVGTLGKAVEIAIRLKEADAEIEQAATQLQIIKNVSRELRKYHAHEEAISRSRGLTSGVSGLGCIVKGSFDLITAIEEAFPKPCDGSQRTRQFRWGLRDQNKVKRLQSQLISIGSLLSTGLQLENV